MINYSIILNIHRHADTIKKKWMMTARLSHSQVKLAWNLEWLLILQYPEMREILSTSCED